MIDGPECVMHRTDVSTVGEPMNWKVDEIFQNGNSTPIATRFAPVDEKDANAGTNYLLTVDGKKYFDSTTTTGTDDLRDFDPRGPVDQPFRKVENGSEEYKKVHAVLDSLDFDKLPSCTLENK